MKTKFKAAFLAVVFQALVGIIFFFGFLLDPLIGICVAGFYFFGIGTFLAYGFFNSAFSS